MRALLQAACQMASSDGAKNALTIFRQKRKTGREWPGRLLEGVLDVQISMAPLADTGDLDP